MFKGLEKLAKDFLPKCDVYNIKFKGKKFLLIGDLTDGAIATKEQYESFETSYAHLCADGKVKRFHKIIGTKDDIKVLGKR